MHALVRFAQIAAAGTFSTGEICPHVTAALGPAAERYNLASLRYNLSKLRAKGLVQKLPRSRRYQLPAKGYSVCMIFLKLFHPALRAAHRRLARVVWLASSPTNENEIPVAAPITAYAFSQTELRKSDSCGAV
jgi:hypothetical protein